MILSDKVSLNEYGRSNTTVSTRKRKRNTDKKFVKSWWKVLGNLLVSINTMSVIGRVIKADKSPLMKNYVSILSVSAY